MVFSLKTEPRKAQVNVAEASSLWNLLRAKYEFVEWSNVWDNYAHDVDFKLFLRKAKEATIAETKKLEIALKHYGIKGPDQYRAFVSTATTSEVLTDQVIASHVMMFIQETVEMILRAIRISVTNDGLRSLFQEIARTAIEYQEVYIKYVKLKGWIESPPQYNMIPSNVSDKLDCMEAHLLWDHLTFRYDNIYLTDCYVNLTTDGDFKLILQKGHEVLLKQAALLEKELIHFGLPAPARPSAVPPPPDHNTGLVEDDHLFRSIFQGMFGASLLHARALKECTTNDRVHELFKKLLYGEMDLIDTLTKYGKMKGWLNPVPHYSDRA